MYVLKFSVFVFTSLLRISAAARQSRLAAAEKMPEIFEMSIKEVNRKFENICES